MTTTTTTTTEIVLPGIVAAPGLQVHQRPPRVPTRGQALIEMEAPGIPFAGQSMRRARYPRHPECPLAPAPHAVRPAPRPGGVAVDGALRAWHVGTGVVDRPRRPGAGDGGLDLGVGRAYQLGTAP